MAINEKSDSSLGTTDCTPDKWWWSLDLVGGTTSCLSLSCLVSIHGFIFNKERNYNLAQWFIPVIPAAGRPEPESYKFKASLGCTLKAKG